MAAVPVETDVTVGQRLTAALWNEDVVAAIDFLLSPPNAQAYASAATVLTTATYGVVAFASEEADNDVMHDNATNNSRVVAKTAGTYLVAASCQIANSATGIRRFQLRKNAAGASGSGTAVLGPISDSNPTAGTSVGLVGSRLITLAANDYLEMFAYQSSGGNLNVNAGAEATFLHMLRVAS